MSTARIESWHREDSRPRTSNPPHPPEEIAEPVLRIASIPVSDRDTVEIVYPLLAELLEAAGWVLKDADLPEPEVASVTSEVPL